MASIVVSSPAAEMEIGQRTQFSAVARNASNQVLTGISFSWTSTQPAIASVDGQGFVTAHSSGETVIQAAAGDRTGTSAVTIRAKVSIQSVTPNPIVEGGTATITGQGFGTQPGALRVTIGGVQAAITSASPTQVVVTVPSDCRPSGPVGVQVNVSTTGSPVFNHSLRAALEPLDLALGTVFLLTPGSGGCLQFSSSAGEQYLVGVQSTSELVSSLTPLRIRALRPSAANGSLAPASRSGGMVPPRDRVSALLRSHRQAELAIRRDEMEIFRRHGTRLEGRAPTRSRLSPSAAVEVGDPFEVRIPDRARSNPCTDFVTTSGVVRAVGQRVIFVEDVENPSGGFTDAEYAALSTLYDGTIFPTLLAQFGPTTDLDGNGRIVVVLSKRLNGWHQTTGALGFVNFVNLVPREECPTSNVGEYYYSLAPDPAGEAGPALPTSVMLSLEKILLAHEVTHLIQHAGRGFFTPGATSLMPPWQGEGQATLAEEVVGFRDRGRTTARNYGPDVVFESAMPNWHFDAFTDLVHYFGFVSPEVSAAGAPEQCSFLGLPAEGNTGPCLGNMAYGVSWSFFRWLSDQAGPANEAALHRRIIQDTGTGFSTIEAATGSKMHDLLAFWAASLYLDDRYTGMAAGTQWSSWNLFAISQAATGTARLTPRGPGTFASDATVSIRAGSTAYYLLGGGPDTSLRVRGASTITLPPNIQIWAVRVR